MITSATITKITSAVVLSKPDVATGAGDVAGAVLKLTVTVTGGVSEL